MATARHRLVDPENECDYHLVSRCVRRAFLCGVDDHDRRDYSHRRAWLVERMRQLAPCFAVDIYAYTVLSNHFHLVLRHDPLAHLGWTDAEVAWRWFEAFPPSARGAVAEDLKPERRELMLGDPDRLARARRTLGSMSDFMKQLRISSCFRRAHRCVRYCFKGDSFPVPTFVTRARCRCPYNEFATFRPRVVAQAATAHPAGLRGTVRTSMERSPSESVAMIVTPPRGGNRVDYRALAMLTVRLLGVVGSWPTAPASVRATPGLDFRR